MAKAAIGMAAVRTLKGRALDAVAWDDVERVMGIEPTYEAWEAAVLPLNYTRDPAGFYCDARAGSSHPSMRVARTVTMRAREPTCT